MPGVDAVRVGFFREQTETLVWQINHALRAEFSTRSVQVSRANGDPGRTGIVINRNRIVRLIRLVRLATL